MTVGGIRDGGYQYVWSPRYIDAPVLRDTLTTSGYGIVEAERVFYLSDANYNVTGLVKYDSGAERVESGGTLQLHSLRRCHLSRRRLGRLH